MNFISSALDLNVDQDNGMLELFQNATHKPRIRKFIQDCSENINHLNLALGQPKGESIHASAVLILPDEKTVYEWLPVKWGEKDGQKLLVTEWEGGELEKAGFLKEDILGIKQLDKFSSILNSIKEQTSKEIDIYTLPKDDEKVFKYFQNGWNGDVFHFGSKGLTTYCKQLQPESIDDLIAGIALYRPGTMESNFHNEYIFRKNGDREVEYFEGCRDITFDTYGLLIYQEQIMKACQQVAGFSLVEADDIRKAMGKKDQALLDKYGERFIEGSIKNGYRREGVEELWGIMKEFAKYGFNRSHAAAYSMTGYIGQWLKVHYPIHFWATAFTFAGDDDIPAYISEINHTGAIRVTPPNVNISSDKFTPDFQNNKIAWSLSSIKQLGEKAVEQILNDRSEKGIYFSLEEFISRHTFTGSKVNKSVVENLILSGAFDDIENIKEPQQRQSLIEQYRKIANTKIAIKEKDWYLSNKDVWGDKWWWDLKQKSLCGFALFDYEDLCDQLILESDFEFKSAEQILTDKREGRQKIKTGGYITEINIRTSKKVGEYANITLEHNYEFISVTIWASEWAVVRELLEESSKKLLIMSGEMVYDVKYGNTLQSFQDTEIFILE